jgi:hypothetical protein
MTALLTLAAAAVLAVSGMWWAAAGFALVGLAAIAVRAIVNRFGEVPYIE